MPPKKLRRNQQRGKSKKITKADLSRFLRKLLYYGVPATIVAIISKTIYDTYTHRHQIKELLNDIYFNSESSNKIKL